MKALILGGVLVSASVFAADVQRLADKPTAVVLNNDTCVISGALARSVSAISTGTHVGKYRVTRKGGIANAPVLLVNTETGESYPATSDDEGFYVVKVPYTGRAEYREESPDRGGRWSRPSVICQGSSVSVGTVEKLS